MPRDYIELPKLDENNRWTGEWHRPVKVYVASTLAGLRAATRYHVVSDVQLQRDLRGRTIADVYRENRALRGPEYRYVPKHMLTLWDSAKRENRPTVCGGLYAAAQHQTIEDEYLAWCKARNHTPHPASIDSDHPMHAGQRERCPKREAVEA